mmetsp:Transcript_4538/g.10378  ORF Transcript_4538/g.10378 Transcript_4538/m.10378 type:complete len:127 (+) Transcript_4538:75-455(+)|eukprot:CAMPEP_0197900646 /NCGR_PEP_ID=MMETSP1439-20131203/49525_1 /TAXON_ID=66791 /ORGANISM="Gonyaulax spinifera, Strain CCMP409" /LENGTH=126 /DNA_ID=CAMNT_0043521547 /DNA_START=75 /DNA_END=455 /DNA_ORIENTATION=-
MPRPMASWAAAAAVITTLVACAAAETPALRRPEGITLNRDQPRRALQAPGVGVGSDLTLVSLAQALPPELRVEVPAAATITPPMGYAEDSLHDDPPVRLSTLQLPQITAEQANRLAFGDNDDTENF